MAWETSNRRDRLPPDWPRIRKRVIRRDKGQCQVVVEPGRKCLEPFRDIDHIEAGDDHSMRNLQCICAWHHKKKSSAEGAGALWLKRKEIEKRFSLEETHPGLL